MTSPIPTLFRISTLAAVLLGAQGQALAQFTVDFRIELPTEEGDRFTATSTQTTIEEYFSYARCKCTEALAVEELPTCDNGSPNAYTQGMFRVVMPVAGEPPTTDPGASFQVGTDCAAEDPNSRTCVELETIPDITEDNEQNHCIPASKFMFPEGVCEPRTAQRQIWLLFDDDGTPSNGFDASYSSQEITIDAEPPALPALDSIKASPSEESVVISWEIPNQDPPDYYQVLCIEEEGLEPLFPDTEIAPRYETTDRLCPDAILVEEPDPMVDAGPGDGRGGEPGDGEIPPLLADLSADFLCGDTVGSSSSVTVDGLENGVSYQFVLVAVDKAGNYRAAYAGTASPAPAIDFWEDYQRNGGGAEGGICLVTSTFGDGGGFSNTLRDFRDDTLARFAFGRAIIAFYYDHIAGLGVYVERYTAARVAAAIVLTPLVGLAALWEYTGPLAKLLLLCGLIWLYRRRRQRRQRRQRVADERPDSGHLPWRPRALAFAAGAAVLVAVVLAAAPALAQDASDPYWDEFQPIEDHASSSSVPMWNVGVKLGPYLPDIDGDPSLGGIDPGPWERTFGGSGIMGAVEVDRYFLVAFGQLGVTASAGFMGRSARAFLTEACTTGDDCIDGVRPVDEDGDGIPARSGADTSFRMIPTSLGAVYRLTVLDDMFHIPVVPYGRAGLSYYLWWITRPTGGVAEYPVDDCTAADRGECDQNRALGASIGYQFSVGIAVRAERLDPQAALSLRNDMGVEHAGFYAELAYAKVDGFGSDTRLPVGALTWFGGLNFEF